MLDQQGKQLLPAISRCWFTNKFAKERANDRGYGCAIRVQGTPQGERPVNIRCDTPVRLQMPQPEELHLRPKPVMQATASILKHNNLVAFCQEVPKRQKPPCTSSDLGLLSGRTITGRCQILDDLGFSRMKSTPPSTQVAMTLNVAFATLLPNRRVA